MEIGKMAASMRKDEISTTYIQKSTPDGLRSEMSKTLKFLIENMCEYLTDFRVGNVFLNKKKKSGYKKRLSV